MKNLLQYLLGLALLLFPNALSLTAQETPTPTPVPGPEITHGMELTPEMTGLLNPSVLGASGAVVSENDGQVIENLFVTVSGQGAVGIHVLHNDVTIRNCKVRHRDQANGIRVSSEASNVLIENCVVEDDLATGWIADVGSIGILAYGDTTIRRNYLRGYRAGMQPHNDNVTITENYFAHNFDGSRPTWQNKGSGMSWRGSSSGTGNLIVQRNYINLTGSRSSGVALYANNPIVNVTLRDNYIIGNGGGWGIVGGESSHGAKESNENIHIYGNRFAGDFEWPGVLGEGTNAGVNVNRPGSVWDDNRWVEGWGDHTVDLPPRCGIRQNACED